eukprot:538136_1
MLPTYQQQELLLFGYGRTNCKTYHIPFPITKMMLAYYNDVNIVTYKNESLETFLNKKNNQYLTTCKPFRINEIQFQTRIYPNGRKTHELGFVTFGIHFTSPCTNIDKIIIYYELYCYDTLKYIKGTKPLTFNTKQNGINGKYSIPWVKLSKCNSKTCLRFGMYIHITQICYLHKLTPATFYERLQIQRSVSFKWHIKDKLLLDIKSVDINGLRCYYSPNFGGYNTWYFRFRPDKNNTYIALLRRTFPPNIKQIELKYSMVLICDTKSYYKDKKLQLKTGAGWLGMELNFNGVGWMDIVGSRHLQIGIKFDIIKACDSNNKQIKAKDFSKYGIVWSW